MGKIEQIKNAIEKAIKRESKLTEDAMNVAGFTSINIRHLQNNLGAISSMYLSVGVHKGGDFISTLFNNNIEVATAVDNFCEFCRGGETKEYFLEKSHSLIPQKTLWSLIEQDCFTIKEFPVKYDLYSYDAGHSESEQQRGVTYYAPHMQDEFIMVVDDWQFNGVESGTRTGIKIANLDILFEQSFYTKDGEEPNEAFHNGYWVALLKKK